MQFAGGSTTTEPGRGPGASARQVPPPGTIVNVDKADPGDLRLLDLAEGELEDVERALRRLDEGTYAICEVCGRTIGEDRLASSAVTRRCADHAPAVPPGSPPGI